VNISEIIGNMKKCFQQKFHGFECTL